MADPSGIPQPLPRPRWLKVSLIVAAGVVLLLVVVALASGGQHGPGQHLPGGNPVGHTPPAQHNS